jgi:hypothetical protein
MTATWSAYPDKSATFSKIAILGLTKNLEARTLIEDFIERKLNRSGFNAVAGLDFLLPNTTKENADIEIIRRLITINEFDAVLVVSVMGINDTRRYVPGSYLYSPIHTTSFYDYYGQMSNYLYSPGYYTGSMNVFVETNLYSFPDETLIWSGQSKTSDISNLEKSADIFSDIIVKELVMSKVITP